PPTAPPRSDTPDPGDRTSSGSDASTAVKGETRREKGWRLRGVNVDEGGVVVEDARVLGAALVLARVVVEVHLEVAVPDVVVGVVDRAQAGALAAEAGHGGEAGVLAVEVAVLDGSQLE